MPNPNDIHGMDQPMPVTTKARKDDKTYTVREMIRALMDAEDMDAIVHVRFLDASPIPVTNVDFEESQVILDGSIV